MTTDLQKLISKAIHKIEELLQSNSVKDAEAIAKQLLVVDPSNVQGLQLHGLILHKKQNYKEAIEVLRKAIDLDEQNCESQNNIALCYLHSGANSAALQSINRALEISPNNVNFLNNKGLIQRASDNIDDAIQTFRYAIDLDPNNAKSWENLGSVSGEAKNLNYAIQCFQKSLEIDPLNLGVHVDLAYGYHLKGEWEKAWPEYEHRLKYWSEIGRTPVLFQAMYPRDKQWDGIASLENKSIVVYCEQGAGDMIQFVRFVPELKKRGAKVFIDAPSSLVHIFDEFGTPRPSHEMPCDFNCSILSLPYLLNIFHPDGKPYLAARTKLDMTDYDGFFKIGIVWAGNPAHPNDVNRSLRLSYFRGISQMPNVKLFSLQKELGNRVYALSPDIEIDLAADCGDMKLIDTSDLMRDYLGTAAVIEAMDLVISVDTSVLHLAGALGKETWALIPFNPDWRWTIFGDKTVWYDSMTLFRQPKPGDWSSVFDEIQRQVHKKTCLF